MGNKYSTPTESKLQQAEPPHTAVVAPASVAEKGQQQEPRRYHRGDSPPPVIKVRRSPLQHPQIIVGTTTTTASNALSISLQDDEPSTSSSSASNSNHKEDHHQPLKPSAISSGPQSPPVLASTVATAAAAASEQMVEEILEELTVRNDSSSSGRMNKTITSGSRSALGVVDSRTQQVNTVVTPAIGTNTTTTTASSSGNNRSTSAEPMNCTETSGAKLAAGEISQTNNNNANRLVVTTAATVKVTTKTAEPEQPQVVDDDQQWTTKNPTRKGISRNFQLPQNQVIKTTSTTTSRMVTTSSGIVREVVEPIVSVVNNDDGDGANQKELRRKQQRQQEPLEKEVSNRDNSGDHTSKTNINILTAVAVVPSHDDDDDDKLSIDGKDPTEKVEPSNPQRLEEKDSPQNTPSSINSMATVSEEADEEEEEALLTNNDKTDKSRSYDEANEDYYTSEIALLEDARKGNVPIVPSRSVALKAIKKAMDDLVGSHDLFNVNNDHEEYDYDESGIPTSNKILNENLHTLGELLCHLPPQHRIFLLPLRHRYTSTALATGGIQALEKEDRNMAFAIRNARTTRDSSHSTTTCGRWKLRIVTVNKTVWEGGDTNGKVDGTCRRRTCHGKCSCFKNESSPSLARNGFSEVGSQSDMLHFDKLVNFSSMDDKNGMVLADEKAMERLWKDSTRDSPNGTRGTRSSSSRKKTVYSTQMLLAFSTEGSVEMLCHSSLPSALEYATTIESTISDAVTVLTYLIRSKRTISWSAFSALGSRLMDSSPNVMIRKHRATALFSIVPSIPPSSAAIVFIQSVLTSCEDATTQQAIVDSLTHRILLPANNRYDSVLSFLKSYELAMAIEDLCLPIIFHTVCATMVRIFQLYPPTSIVGNGNKSSTFPMYAQKVKESIRRLTSNHGWLKVCDVVEHTMETILQFKVESPEVFMAIVDLAQAIRPVMETNTYDWPKQLVEQICLEIVKSRFPKRDSQEFCTFLFSHPQVQSCIQFLLELGAPEQFGRLFRWAIIARPEDVIQFSNLLQRAETAGLPIFNSDKAAVGKQVVAIHEFAKRKKLAKLQLERSAILDQTRLGSPKQWNNSCFHASLPDAIRQFLSSNEPGPMAYFHELGIDHSRSLASFSGVGYRIQATNYLCVIVTKTKEQYAQEKEKYAKKVAELNKLNSEIIQLGGVLDDGSAPIESKPTAKRDSKYYTVSFKPGTLGVVADQVKGKLGFEVINIRDGGQASLAKTIHIGDYMVMLNGELIDSLDEIGNRSNDGRRRITFFRPPMELPANPLLPSPHSVATTCAAEKIPKSSQPARLPAKRVNGMNGSFESQTSQSKNKRIKLNNTGAEMVGGNGDVAPNPTVAAVINQMQATPQAVVDGPKQGKAKDMAPKVGKPISNGPAKQQTNFPLSSSNLGFKMKKETLIFQFSVTAEPGALGLRVDNSRSRFGLRTNVVEASSQMRKSGKIRAGDYLSMCNGQLLHTPAQLRIASDKDREITVVREIKASQFSVTFAPGGIGITVNKDMAPLGLPVVDLVDGGQASKVGKIKKGDYLTKLNGRLISSFEELGGFTNQGRTITFSRVAANDLPSEKRSHNSIEVLAPEAIPVEEVSSHHLSEGSRAAKRARIGPPPSQHPGIIYID